MLSLKTVFLDSGVVSKEQARKMESDRRQREALARFKQSGILCDFNHAYPEFKNSLQGFPLDTRVFICLELEHKKLWARWPKYSQRLKASYGSPLLGTILVVRADGQTGEILKMPIEPVDSGKEVSSIGCSSTVSIAVVEQSLSELLIYVKPMASKYTAGQ